MHKVHCHFCIALEKLCDLAKFAAINVLPYFFS